MGWTCFSLTYELRSPLHIGYAKVGNVQRTHYYVPARLLWGALTAVLTRAGFHIEEIAAGDYQGIGKWVQEHCAFSYFFIQDREQLLFPWYTETGLRYGNFLVNDFERCFLDSHLGTAIEASSNAAEEGSLHEVEFITPYYPVVPGKDEPVSRTVFRGWLFLDDIALKTFDEQKKWRVCWKELQWGGERRYGFGRVSLKDWKSDTSSKEESFPNAYEIDLKSSRPRVKVPKEKPLLAHGLVDSFSASGQIEPLVGRETHTSSTFGVSLTPAKLCWTPGSIVSQETWFEICKTGIWKSVSSAS